MKHSEANDSSRKIDELGVWGVRKEVGLVGGGRRRRCRLLVSASSRIHLKLLLRNMIGRQHDHRLIPCVWFQNCYYQTANLVAAPSHSRSGFVLTTVECSTSISHDFTSCGGVVV